MSCSKTLVPDTRPVTLPPMEYVGADEGATLLDVPLEPPPHEPNDRVAASDSATS